MADLEFVYAFGASLGMSPQEVADALADGHVGPAFDVDVPATVSAPRVGHADD